jgi:hypothetical protein
MESHECLGSVESWPLLSKLRFVRDSNSFCRKEFCITITKWKVVCDRRECRMVYSSTHQEELFETLSASFQRRRVNEFYLRHLFRNNRFIVCP